MNASSTSKIGFVRTIINKVSAAFAQPQRKPLSEQRRARLSVECLEDRLVQSATAMTSTAAPLAQAAVVQTAGHIPAPTHYTVGGAIAVEYNKLGGARSFLGNPTSGEIVGANNGRYQTFQGGTIAWSPATGAHEIHGAIRDEWNSLGGTYSFLGYPTTDETTTNAGIGRYNDFQSGTILWSQYTGAHEIHGAIRNEWNSLGGARSFLGFPTTDETETNAGNGRYNNFQNGTIVWSQYTGAHEVHGAIRDLWSSLGGTKSSLGYATSDEYNFNGGRRSNFQGGYIYWNASTGAHVIYNQVTPPVHYGNPFPGLPDLSGTWKGRWYGQTYTIQAISGGYSVHCSDGTNGIITKQGNTLVVTFGSGKNAWSAITAVSGIKSSEIDWANPPPDGTSWEQWLR